MPQETLIHVSEPGEGEQVWWGGAHMTVKASSDWSDAFSLVEVATDGRATPLHTDPSDETFYVLEGSLLFWLDGQERAAPAGTVVSIRRGVPHAFRVTAGPARFLVLNTPGTHDKMFLAGGEPAHGGDAVAAPEGDSGRMMSAMRHHGVQVLGPPPFELPAAG